MGGVFDQRWAWSKNFARTTCTINILYSFTGVSSYVTAELPSLKLVADMFSNEHLSNMQLSISFVEGRHHHWYSKG